MARNRTVSTKVSQQEFEQLEDFAQASNLSLSQWCRQALLAQVSQGDIKPDETATLLAEVLGLRTIVLNLLYSLGRGEKLAPEKVQSLIERADREKLATALERLGRKPARKKAASK